MGIPPFLARLLPLKIRLRFVKEERTSRFILDETTFPECVSKEIGVWSWRRFKTEKHLVHYKEGKFITKRLRE